MIVLIIHFKWETELLLLFKNYALESKTSLSKDEMKAHLVFWASSAHFQVKLSFSPTNTSRLFSWSCSPFTFSSRTLCLCSWLTQLTCPCWPRPSSPACAGHSGWHPLPAVWDWPSQLSTISTHTLQGCPGSQRQPKVLDSTDTPKQPWEPHCSPQQHQTMNNNFGCDHPAKSICQIHISPISTAPFF